MGITTPTQQGHRCHRQGLVRLNYAYTPRPPLPSREYKAGGCTPWHLIIETDCQAISQKGFRVGTIKTNDCKYTLNTSHMKIKSLNLMEHQSSHKMCKEILRSNGSAETARVLLLMAIRSSSCKKPKENISSINKAAKCFAGSELCNRLLGNCERSPEKWTFRVFMGSGHSASGV